VQASDVGRLQVGGRTHGLTVIEAERVREGGRSCCSLQGRVSEEMVGGGVSYDTIEESGGT
jgi:hypothetical protein